MDGPLAQFLFTRSEIEALEGAVGAAITQYEANLEVARAPAMREVLQERYSTLNSLRTVLAEGRYGIERVTE